MNELVYSPLEHDRPDRSTAMAARLELQLGSMRTRAQVRVSTRTLMMAGGIIAGIALTATALALVSGAARRRKRNAGLELERARPARLLSGPDRRKPDLLDLILPAPERSSSRKR